MKSTRRAGCFVGAVVVALLALPAGALGPVSISVEGVPERLCFPLDEGANWVLTASIEGGAVKSVWLAIRDGDGYGEWAKQRVELAKVEDSQYAINLGASEVFELLKRAGSSGQFHIYAQAEDGTIAKSMAVRYTMQVAPPRLDFPFDEARMTIYQRQSKQIPGSGGALTIWLGDITAGQVAATIYGPRGEAVVDTTSMKQGDILTLDLAEQDYVVQLDELVNLLAGDDYGIFTLMPAGQFEAHRIDDLLRVIETAEATFIRNDQELSGKEFAAVLRGKYEHFGPKGASLYEFIEQVGSESSTSGEPYQVKLTTGQIVESGPWLREQAAMIGSRARAAEPAASKE